MTVPKEQDERRSEPARLSAELRPYGDARPRSETLVEAECVVVTFHLPELGPHGVGHHVRSGMLVVWSRDGDLPYHAMVPLPHDSGSNPYVGRSNNGVVEFVFARRPDGTRPTI